jgi:hypothetical protein
MHKITNMPYADILNLLILFLDYDGRVAKSFYLFWQRGFWRYRDMTALTIDGVATRKYIPSLK